MTMLPPNIEEVISKQLPENIEHRWGFSIVPARIGGWQAATKDDRIEFASEIGIYLAGHCRDCNKVVTAPLPFGNNIQETQIAIPRFGCVDPRFVGL